VGRQEAVLPVVSTGPLSRHEPIVAGAVSAFQLACPCQPATMRLRRNAMSIDLTEQQRQAVLNGEAVRLQAPELGTTVVLLREEQFQRLQALLEEEQDRKAQEAFLKASQQSAVAWMKENPY
jgi:hypothetical protein